MKLIITRHAKSSWDDPLAGDHDRTLNARGRANAPNMGRWLVSKNYIPTQALCSTATRARETWDFIQGELPEPVQTDFRDGLYHANPDVILTHIRRSPPGDLILIGHNPGIAWFAQRLLSSAPTHPRFQDYPTAATTVVDTDIKSWSELGFGDCSFVDFAIPRELEAS